MTALHFAASYSSASIVRALIEAGAEVNARDSWKRSPLHLSAGHNPAAVPVLLEANADVNVLNDGNNSPLFRAAWKNQRDSVIALCNTGADPHMGNSPLTSSLVDSDMKSLIRMHSSL